MISSFLKDVARSCLLEVKKLGYDRMLITILGATYCNLRVTFHS